MIIYTITKYKTKVLIAKNLLFVKKREDNLKTGFSIISLDELPQDISFQCNYKSSCTFVLPQAASFASQANASADHPLGLFI